MRYLFDISTSARWGGHAVGIVRVERELGRRVQTELGEESGYCIYSRRDGCFYEVGAEAAHLILRGKLQVDFDATAPVRPTSPAPIINTRSLTKKIRNRLIQYPRIYQLVQAARGHNFSIEYIYQMKAQENSLIKNETVAQTNTLNSDEISIGRISLTNEITIISGGLDWEYKDMRNIYKLRRSFKFNYATIIYDLIPLKYPQFVVPQYVSLLTEYFGELFWSANIFMAISSCTQSDMIEYCNKNGVPIGRNTYFPLGSDLPPSSDIGVLPRALDKKEYAIFVSTIEPRKNHRVIYLAWEYCLRAGWIDRTKHRLVFVGREGWAVGDLMHEISHNPLVRDTIVRLHDVSDAELACLYRGAKFGLYPSFYEGYGLPLAEMLGYGKACISSRSGSLIEVGGDLVRYEDPFDVIGWARAIADFFNNPASRRALEKKISAAHTPVTWESAATTFFHELKALCEPL